MSPEDGKKSLTKPRFVSDFFQCSVLLVFYPCMHSVRIVMSETSVRDERRTGILGRWRIEEPNEKWDERRKQSRPENDNIFIRFFWRMSFVRFIFWRMSFVRFIMFEFAENIVFLFHRPRHYGNVRYKVWASFIVFRGLRCNDPVVS